MEREKPQEKKQQPAITPFYFKLLRKLAVQELLRKREYLSEFFQVVKNNLFQANDRPNNL